MPGGMPLDLSGITNSFNSLPQAPDYANQAQSAYSGIPAIHGVDLSNLPQSTFQVSPQDFMKTPATSAPSGGANFMSHLLGGVSPQGSTGSVGHSFNLWDRLNGVLKGWENAPVPQNDFNPLDTIVNGVKGAVQGWNNPDQTTQAWNQANAQADQNLSPFMRGVAGFSQGLAGSPLTFVPGAAFTKPIGLVARATGITPALKFGMDWLRGAVKSSSPETGTVAQTLTDAVNNAPKIKPPMDTSAQTAANINDWAGLGNGYKGAIIPQIEQTVPTTLPNIAPIGKFLSPQAGANNKLATLFNLATEKGLPAGREPEALQDLLGSISDRNGVNLENLINQSTMPLKIPPSLLDRANTARAAGVPWMMSPQVFKQGLKTVLQDAPKGETGFELRGGPLMVLPKAAEEAAATASHAGANAPYALYDWQHVLGAPLANWMTRMAPNGIPVAREVINGLGNVGNLLFNTLPGVSQAAKAAYARFVNNQGADAVHYGQRIQDIFHGTTPQEQEALIHALEPTAQGTKLTDPRLESIRQALDPFREELTNQAQRAGLVKDLLDTNKMAVGQYIPHIPVEKFSLNPIPKGFGGHSLKETIDAGNQRTIPGTIKQISGNPANPKFESNGVKIFTNHALQMSKAIRTRQFIDEVMSHGYSPERGLSEGMTDPATGQRLVSYTHHGQTTLLPSSDARLLHNVTSDPSVAQQLGNMYKGAVGLGTKLWFAGTPLYHILYNMIPQAAMHSPSTLVNMFRHMPEAFNGIENGSMMDRALRAGALHTSFEAGAHGSIPKRVEDIFSQVNNTKPIRNAIGKYWTGLTPNFEKAMRTAAFEHALGNGSTDDEAAQFVRSIFGGNQAGQKSFMDTALSLPLPFWNWTKTAALSNAKGMLTRPLPYSALYNGMDAINQANTGGHHIYENKNPLSIALGSKDAKGNPEYISPSVGPMEPVKILNDLLGQNGPVGGAEDYLFKRTTPLIKLPIEFGTGFQDPFASNKFTLDPSPNVPHTPQDESYHTEPLFGQNGGKLVPYQLAQIMQQVPNPISQLAQVLNPNQSATAKLLSNPFFGDGYVSAPNPQSAAKEQSYQQREANSQMKNWLKRYGGG